MSGADFLSDPYSFDPPRFVLDTDEVFPPATVITQSNWATKELEYTYEKKPDGLYTVRVANSPALDPSCDASMYDRLSASRFPAGVIATFPIAGGKMIEYVKGIEGPGAEGRWLLSSVAPMNGTATNASANNLGSRVEVLYQTDYTAYQAPDCPPIEYHYSRLSDILKNDKGSAVRNSEDPAYDLNTVTNKKLSLRLQFPNIVYDHPQFTVQFRTGANKRSITRGELALYIADEMRTLTQRAESDGTPLSKADGTSIQFDRLVLMSVAFRSTGSIQPVIGVVCK